MREPDNEGGKGSYLHRHWACGWNVDAGEVKRSSSGPRGTLKWSLPVLRLQQQRRTFFSGGVWGSPVDPYQRDGVCRGGGGCGEG